jgi:hypothetical protein
MVLAAVVLKEACDRNPAEVVEEELDHGRSNNDDVVHDATFLAAEELQAR